MIKEGYFRSSYLIMFNIIFDAGDTSWEKDMIVNM